jgi:hypothetical protein
MELIAAHRFALRVPSARKQFKSPPRMLTFNRKSIAVCKTTQETEILLNLFFRLLGAKTPVLVVGMHRDEILSRN